MPAGIPPEDEALRLAIRAFLDEHMRNVPLSRRARTWQGFDSAFSRALGEAGFIGLTLPQSLGGGGRGYFARFVVVEELLAAGAPVAAHWIADRQSAPLLLKFGNEAQQREHIPAICRGERYFCIGMSEAGSGSDLASIRTRATRTDKGWRIDGSKIWTTYAQHAHYMIALLRTSGDPEDRHKGLSQILIDLSLPGVSIKPIVDIAGDSHFCEVHFDGVEVSADALIGNEGDGWMQCTAELALERSGPERIYSSLVVLDRWIQDVAAAGASATQIAAIGELTAELAALRELSIAITARLQAGDSPVVEASLIKDLGTSFEQKIPHLLVEMLSGPPDAALDPEMLEGLSYALQMAPSFSLRGGTREILRGIIARGMGLK